MVKSGLNLKSGQSLKMNRGYGLCAHVMVLKSYGVFCLLKFWLHLIWNEKIRSFPVWKETQNPNYMNKLTSRD